MNALIPTAHLRFVERIGSLADDNCRTLKILQQFWAPDVPKYMVDSSQGEWRDIPMEVEAP